MRRVFPTLLLLLAAASFFAAMPVLAEPQIDQKETLALRAAAASSKRDFRIAEEIYTRILGIDPNDADTYVQRALARRELKNLQGMGQDARRAVELTDAQLSQRPNDADLYYDRSVANRLLGNFDDAEQDMRQAYRFGRHGLLDTDLKTIALERKMAQ